MAGNRLDPRPRVRPVGSLAQFAQHRVPHHICGRLNLFRVGELRLKKLIDRCLVLADLLLLTSLEEEGGNFV